MPKAVEPIGKRRASSAHLEGVAILVSEPDARVLFVSSMEARGAAQLLLPSYVGVHCSGPIKQTDFAALTDRLVDIWAPGGPDGAAWAADIAGRILQIAARVRIIDASDQTEGRDLPACVADNWTQEQTQKWAASRAKVIEPPKPAPLAAVTSATPGSALELWQRCGVMLDGKHQPYPNESTGAALLEHAPIFKKRIWFDTFRSRIYHTLHDGIALPWDDSENLRILQWFQTVANIPKMTSDKVWKAVCMVARQNQRNSFTEFLEAQTWDGVPRLERWTVVYLGCPDDEHHRAVGRNFFIGMIARGYEAGCKVDHMPVLEGLMGRGKSTALKIIADPWFVEASQDFGSKAFIEVIQGYLLAEIPDMTGFTKSEHTKILATITTRTDTFRIPWDRLAEPHPRRTVFAATSETSDYLKDTRGIRRYWPLRCGVIDLEGLARDRAQLFAEAAVKYKEGATWHEMPGQTESEQLDRVDSDILTDRVRTFVSGKGEVTASEVFEKGVDIAVNEFGTITPKYSRAPDQRDKDRIGKILRSIGWFNVQKKRNGKNTNLWRPLPAIAAPQDADDDS